MLHPNQRDNSMKVYWTYMYEDSDRDDADGPSWNSTNELGVEPEDFEPTYQNPSTCLPE